MGNTFSRSEALRQVNRIEASKTLSATTKKLATEIKNEITNANTAYQSHRKERTALEQALKSLTDANQKLNDAKKTYKRARTKASDAKKNYAPFEKENDKANAKISSRLSKLLSMETSDRLNAAKRKK